VDEQSIDIRNGSAPEAKSGVEPRYTPDDFEDQMYPHWPVAIRRVLKELRPAIRSLLDSDLDRPRRGQSKPRVKAAQGLSETRRVPTRPPGTAEEEEPLP